MLLVHQINVKLELTYQMDQLALHRLSVSLRIVQLQYVRRGLYQLDLLVVIHHSALLLSVWTPSVRRRNNLAIFVKLANVLRTISARQSLTHT